MVLLLGFLLRSGSLLVLHEEGSVRAHFAVLLRQGLQSSDCGRLLNYVGEAICRLDRVFVRLGLGLSDV